MMKKKILLILTAWVFASAASAQIFVGGTFELNVNSGKVKNESVTRDLTSVTTYKFAPKGGFFLNDEMAVGASIIHDVTRIKTPANGNNSYETVETENTLSIAPFFRYYALDFGPVSVFGEAYMSLGFGGNKTKNGSVTTDDESVFVFGAGVLPGVSYKLTENIDIEAFLGGLKFSRQTTEENDIESINSNFNLSLSSDFGVGFIYKF